MSHLVTAEVPVRDLEILRRACAHLGHNEPVEGSATLYDRSTHEGLVVKLRGWRYPVIFRDGKAYYDNYNGYWGGVGVLHALLQRYAAEEALDAMGEGWTLTEEALPSGELLLSFESEAW